MRFDLTDLSLFLRVAEAGSITHGAALANLAVPSASARLHSMEDMIGLPLLARRARGVDRTPAGTALVHHARIILRQVDQMQGELGDYARSFKTQIRLLANTAAMTGHLPGRLAPFLADQPWVGLAQGTPLQELVRDQAARAGHPIAFRVRMPTFEAMGQMVQWGVGLGFMPETVARRFRRSMAIRALPLTDAWATRQLSLCMRRYGDLPARSRELVDRLAPLQVN